MDLAGGAEITFRGRTAWQEREDMGEPADSRQSKSRRPTDAEFDPKVVLGLKLVSIQSRAG